MAGLVKIEFRYEVVLEFDPVYDDGEGNEVTEEPSLSQLLDEDDKLTEYGKEVASEQMLEGLTDFSDGWFPRYTVNVEHFDA